MVLYKGENNNVEVDINFSTIISFRNQKENNFTFAGIQIIDPQIIRYFPFKRILLKYIKI